MHEKKKTHGKPRSTRKKLLSIHLFPIELLVYTAGNNE